MIFSNKNNVQIDKLQITCRSRVVVSTASLQKFHRRRLNTAMNFHRKITERIDVLRNAQMLALVVRSQKIQCYASQCFLWPGIVPIDRAAIHERREHETSRSETLSDRGERQHNVKILSHSAYKVGQDIVTSVHKT